MIFTSHTETFLAKQVENLTANNPTLHPKLLKLQSKNDTIQLVFNENKPIVHDLMDCYMPIEQSASRDQTDNDSAGTIKFVFEKTVGSIRIILLFDI